MSLFSILMIIFMGFFWVFRVAVALLDALEIEYIITPLNSNIEIALLFITLLALILVIRRNMIGALIYLVSYGLYFGADLYTRITAEVISTEYYASMFISAVAILLAFLLFVDLSFSKDAKTGGGNKKTNWFYGTDKYEREKEDWEDTNQY